MIHRTHSPSNAYRHHADQRTKYPTRLASALLTAAAESLKVGAKNERFAGVRETGFFGVLHTWGQDLTFHPHAHFLVAEHQIFYQRHRRIEVKPKGSADCGLNHRGRREYREVLKRR